MVTGAVCALLLAAGTGAPGTIGSGPRMDALRVGADVVSPDTIKPRRKAFRLSKAYETRLFIHRVASYATLPLFVAEYAAGDQLFKKGTAAPSWARDYHAPLAGALGGLFAINTITGGLNWWETRAQPDGRAWRTAHSALMLLADAGFVATGMLANDVGEIRNSGDQRKKHRAVAVGSMSVATVSYLMMLKPFRRD